MNEVISDFFDEYDNPKPKALVICGYYRRFDIWCVENGYNPRDYNSVRCISSPVDLAGFRNIPNTPIWRVAHIDPTSFSADKFHEIMDLLIANGLYNGDTSI